MRSHLDDVISHSFTWADHLYILEELRKAELTTNPHKCQLGLTEVQDLGYHIDQGLLKPQEKKIEDIKEYPQPTTK